MCALDSSQSAVSLRISLSARLLADFCKVADFRTWALGLKLFTAGAMGSRCQAGLGSVGPQASESVFSVLGKLEQLGASGVLGNSEWAGGRV